MASFIYQIVRAEALKTDMAISFLFGILLTQFLQAIQVPVGVNEPKAFSLRPITEVMLSHSMTYTRQMLSTGRR